MATDYNYLSAGDAIVTDAGDYLTLDELMAEANGQSVDASLPASTSGTGGTSGTQAASVAQRVVDAATGAGQGASEAASRHPVAVAIAIAALGLAFWFWRGRK